MARSIVQRRARWYDIPSFRLGLTTDTDYLMADVRGARLVQNARTRTGRIVKRNGSRYYSPALGSGGAARIAGIHQWYPATREDENRVYAVTSGNIVRLPWSSTSVDPPTTAVAMAFDDGGAFGISQFASFVDFNDYCFAFNGVSRGAQMRFDALNSMYHFQIAKPPAFTIATAGGGSIAAGDYGYAIRYVRERTTRVREYWGALSDTVSITSGGSATNTLTLPVPTDAQITHVYIYRTGTDLETLYYLARVPVGTTTYADTALETSTEIDEETLAPIENIAYATVDDGSLFVVAQDTTTGAWVWYNSIDGRPQEFGVYNNGEISEGSGDVTGVEAFGGQVYVFRERGIIIYAKNSAQTYDRVSFWPGWGNIAPWAVRAIRDGKNNFVSFYDDSEGPCLITGSSVETLKRRKYSDCVKYVDNAGERDNAYRKYVAVAYKRGMLYWSFTPVGQTYNTKCLVWDSAQDCWYGPDTGYSMGPSFTRLTGRGVYGNGELLAAVDGATCYVMEMDAPYSRDFGTVITLQVDSMAVGAEALPNETEFQHIALLAKLSSVFRFNVNVQSSTYTGSYYIAPSGKYFYDDGTTFDSGATFDACVQSLMDSSVFDAGDVFDSQKDLPYQIELDSASAQGAFMTISLYDANSYQFEIARLRILAVDRGDRT